MLDTVTNATGIHPPFDLAAPERFAGDGSLTGTAPSGPLASGRAQTAYGRAMQSWFVIHHRPSVGPVLAERVASLGFDVRRFREERRRRGRDDWFEPVFPGYLFVQLNPAEKRWGTIAQQHGVIGILGVRKGDYNLPISVPQCRMDELLNHFDERGERRLPAPVPAKRHAVGSKLRILADKWIDHIGVCQASSPDRVKVLLNIFGRETPVSLSSSQVQGVSE